MTTTVKPADIPLFSTSLPRPEDSADKSVGSQDQGGSQSSGFGDTAAEYAVYSNATDHMCVLGLQDEVSVSLSGELLQAC